MTRSSVRTLRILAVAGPLFLFFVILHFAAPPLRVLHRERTLPAGYEHLGSYGPYELFARPENKTAQTAGRVLEVFIGLVLAEFGEAMGLTLTDSRCDVIVFSTHSDLSAFTSDQLESDFERNDGFYLPSQRAMGVVSREDEMHMIRSLFHEGTHMILDAFAGEGSADWSVWLNEGLASWLEVSGIDAEGRVSLGGYDPADAATILAAAREPGKWLGVERLLGAPAGAWSGEHNRIYYATAALLVHLLMEGKGGKYRELFFAYLREEREPGPVDARAFRRIIGDPAELDKALVRHAERLR